MATEPETSRDRLLYEVAADLTSTLDLDQVLRTLIDKVIDLMNASRGFIVLVEDGVMRVRMARSESGYDPSVFEGSRTVVEPAGAPATAVITTDAISDDRLQGPPSEIQRHLR